MRTLRVVVPRKNKCVCVCVCVCVCIHKQSGFKLHWYTSRSCRWITVKSECSESPCRQHARLSNTVSPVEFASIRVHLPLPVVMCLLVQRLVPRVWSLWTALRFFDVACTPRLCCEFVYVGAWLQQNVCVSVARNDGYAPRVWCRRQKRQDSSAVISTTSVAQNVCIPQSSVNREGGGGYIFPVCFKLPALKGLLGAVTATIRTACAPRSWLAECGSYTTGAPWLHSTNAQERRKACFLCVGLGVVIISLTCSLTRPKSRVSAWPSSSPPSSHCTRVALQNSKFPPFITYGNFSHIL